MVAKKIYILLLIFVPVYGFSQIRKPITGFLGVPFGSDRQTVQAALLAKGATLDKDSSTDEMLAFTNVAIENRKNAALGVQFVKGKAYAAAFIFPDQPMDKPIEFYNNLVRDFNEIYGLSESHKDFTSPYHEGDGKEMEAIQAEKAVYLTMWKDEANDNAVTITIGVNLYVYITIHNQKLGELAEEKNH